MNQTSKWKIWLVFVLATLATLWCGAAAGQKGGVKKYPKVGMSFPGYVFKDVQDYKKRSLSMAELRGKWVVLDFWARTCPVCIDEMQTMQAIQDTYGDTVRVLLVGVNVSYAGLLERRAHPERTGDWYIRDLYRKVKARKHLRLPVAWDSVLFSRMLGFGVPYMVVIDPSGVVRALASSITVKEMADWLNGREPLYAAYRLATPPPGMKPYDMHIPLLTNGVMANGGCDTGFLFRDVFVRLDPSVYMPYGMVFRNGTFDVLNLPLSSMYRIAFLGKLDWTYADTSVYGRVAQEVVLETRDSMELSLGQQYAYSLTVDKVVRVPPQRPNREEEEIFMSQFQRDLTSHFPYMARLEDRPTRYYRLVALDRAKLSQCNTHGGSTSMVLKSTEILAKNCPLSEFAGKVLAETSEDGTYVENATGVSGNIDVDLDAVSADFADVRRALGTIGLGLVEEKKPMKTLIISDRHN